jgi:uncharacterized protein YraI
LVAVVRGAGTELYDRPDGAVVQALSTGTALTAWGRSGDAAWIVVTSSGDQAGWVEVTDVVIFNVDTLPVVDGSAPPDNGGDAPAAEVDEPAVTAAEETAESLPVEPPATDDAIYATVAVTDSRLNIRAGPGTGFVILGKAEPGERLRATGRNADASWVEVETPALGDGYGWVAVGYVTLSHPLLGLPVSERTGAQAISHPVDSQQSAVSSQQSPVQAEPRPEGARGLSGRLVFQSAPGGMIYVYDLATGALAELTGGFDPAISPDGRTVAFTRIGGDNGLYLIDIDGQNERRIYAGGEQLRGPAWSPDGQWIAFVRIAGDFPCRDVGFGLCLPDAEGFLDSFPLVAQPEWGLSRVDINGEQYRDLPALTSVQAPDWGTGGIVYQANTGLEITADQPDATTRSVVNEPFHQDPAWQPESDRIVFQRREGSHWELFSINADGSGLAALTKPVTTLVDELPSNVAPAWSPDGQWIVYLSNRNDENSAGEWRLWVMDAGGGNQRPLPVTTPIEYTFGNEQVVAWGIPG